MIIFPFLMVRVGGLPLNLTDEMAIEDPNVFEKTIQNPGLLAAEFLRIYQKMQAFSQLPEIEKSLLFASHDLLDRLPKFREILPSNFVKKQRQTATALYEYLARAATKTSPFSRLTTVQLIDFQKLALSETTSAPDFEMPFRWADSPVFGESNDGLKFRHTANAALLERLFDELLSDEKFASQLEIRLNPGFVLSKKNDLLFPFFDGETEAVQQIENSPPIEKLIQFFGAKPGKQTPLKNLISHLSAEFETANSELQAFVSQLVALGLLEFLPPVSGLEPDWSSRFLNRLAFFQPFEKQDEIARHFHGLNAAAKQLAWMTTHQAQAAQIEAASLSISLFENENSGPVSPEKIWFQDVASEQPIDLLKNDAEEIVSLLCEAMEAAGAHPPTNLQAKAAHFFDENFEEIDSPGFVEFSHLFFQNRQKPGAVPSAILSPKNWLAGQKMAAQLQFFKSEKGEIGAVVNSIFPGGGRLFGRFLPLFPEKATEKLLEWNQPDQSDEFQFSFTGQAWHNANLTPVLAEFELDFHGSRPRLAAEKRVPLAEIFLKKETETGCLRLIHGPTKKWIRLLDHALEAPDGRSPVLQLFRALAIPFFSKNWLVEQLFSENEKAGFEAIGGRFLPRLVLKNRLILRRATWIFDAEKMPRRARETSPESEFFREIWAFKKAANLPRRVFFQTNGKPQFVDFQSVISLRLFLKNLPVANGSVIFTEMWPMEKELLTGLPDEKRVAEMVVEWK